MRILRTMLAAAALLLMLLAAAYGLLQSGPGKRWLAAALSHRLSTPEQTVTLHGLSGRVPFHIRLEDVEVADRDGVWLRIRNLRADWSAALFPLTVTVDRLEAEAVHALRRPLPAPEAAPSRLSFRWPELPRVAVNRLALPRITVEAELAGARQVLAAEGTIRTFPAAGAGNRLDLRTLEGPETRLTLDSATGRLNGSLHEAPGGVLGGLTGLGDGLEGTLEAGGDGGRWRIALSLSGGGRPLITARAESAAGAERLALTAGATLHVPPAPRFDALRAALGETAEAEADLALDAAGILTLHTARLSAANLEATLTGTYGGGEAALRYGLAVRDLMPVAGVTGHLAATGELTGPPGALRLLGEGSGAVHDLTDLTLRYDMTLQDGALTIREASAAAPHLTLRVTGTAPLAAGGEAELAVEAATSDLARLLPGAGGAWTLAATAAGPYDAIRFTADARGTALDRMPGAPGRLLAPEAAVRAEGYLEGRSDERRAVLSAVTLTAARSRGEGRGAYRFTDGRIEAEAALDLDDAAALVPALQGALALEGKAEGPPAQLEGTLAARLRRSGAELRLATGFTLTDRLFRAADIRGEAGNVRLTGALAANLENRLLDGALTLTASDLAALNPFLAAPLAGSGEATVRLTPAAPRQEIAARGAWKGLGGGGIHAAGLTFDLALRDAAALTGLSGTAEAAAVTSGDSVLADALTLRATPTADGARLTAEARAAGASPWQAAAAAHIAPALPDWRITLERLEGEARRHRFALQAPAALRRSGGTLSAEPIALTIGGGTARLSGSLTPAAADIRLAAERLPLSLLAGPDLSGQVTGEARVSGPPARPTVTAALRATGLTRQSGEALPFGLALTADLTTPVLEAALEMVDGKGTLIANGTVPAAFSLSPPAFSLDRNGPLRATLRADADLAPLAALALPEGQSLSGTLRGAMTAGGTLAAPVPGGDMAVLDGRYRHNGTGTRLDAIDALFRAAPGRVEVVRLTATDGREGRLSLSGGIGTASPHPITAAATLTGMTLIDSREASGTVGGDLRLSGTPAELLAAGALTVGPMEIRLPEATGPDIPEVRVLNPDVLPAQAWQKPPSSFSGPAAVAFDLTLNAPERVFVRGRGLETEVRGTLKMTGTMADPHVDGTLTAVHGTFTLLDRALAITEGVLTFQGAIPPSPFLRMVAETTTRDITASIRLEGPVREPALALSSTPSLPQDEILAHLLFGRELRSITPFQAVQLAQAFQTLRGRNSGPDLLGRARNLLKVDRLNVGSDADNNLAVGAGKYVSDKVYIGVEGGGAAEAGKVKAEIEVTPRISVETETGARSSGARLNWKWDY